MQEKRQISLLLILILFFALSCEKEEKSQGNTLSVESLFSVDIEELSGLGILNSEILYTVSDNTNQIYKISKTGTVLSHFSYIGEDLEGIAVNPVDKTIFVVEERKREIVQFSQLGEKIKTIKVSVEESDINSGLEGICINSINNHIFVLNEKSPRKLIELNSSGSQLRATDLLFASDFSGMCIDSENQKLWIVSDEARKIFQCDLLGNKLQEYNISINKMEGITIDLENDYIYIVSDSYKKIYKLKLPI